MEGYVSVLPRVKSRLIICNKNIVIIENVMEPGALVEKHAHESLQVTIALKGSLKLGVENQGEILLKAGEYIIIPPGTGHWASTSEGAVILDINTPFTQDRRPLVEKLGGCEA